MSVKDKTTVKVNSGETIELDGDYIIIQRDKFDSIVDDATSWLQSGQQGKSSGITSVAPFPDL